MVRATLLGKLGKWPFTPHNNRSWWKENWPGNWRWKSMRFIVHASSHYRVQFRQLGIEDICIHIGTTDIVSWCDTSRWQGDLASWRHASVNWSLVNWEIILSTQVPCIHAKKFYWVLLSIVGRSTRKIYLQHPWWPIYIPYEEPYRSDHIGRQCGRLSCILPTHNLSSWDIYPVLSHLLSACLAQFDVFSRWSQSTLIFPSTSHVARARVQANSFSKDAP